MSMRLICYRDYEKIYSCISEIFQKARMNQFKNIRPQLSLDIENGEFDSKDKYIQVVSKIYAVIRYQIYQSVKERRLNKLRQESEQGLDNLEHLSQDTDEEEKMNTYNPFKPGKQMSKKA